MQIILLKLLLNLLVVDFSSINLGQIIPGMKFQYINYI